jgi:hypothetical protein
MSLTPQTGNSPSAEPDTEQDGQQRRHWLLLLCFALFSFEIGIFLLVFPWMDNWSLNYFPGAFPRLEEVWEEPALKGALSGLGVVNIYVAILQLMRLFRGSDPSS